MTFFNLIRHKLFFLVLITVCLSTRAVFAQNTLEEAASRFKKWERIEGNIEQTSNGTTTRAHLSYQAPDNLRIEFEENPASGTRAQIILARGEETRLYDPGTRRVQRWSFNITQQPWRGWNLQAGGPANFLLFGLSPVALEKFYVRGPATNSIALTTRPDYKPRLKNDYVRFGGGGDRMFYAPFKRPVWEIPQRIELAQSTLAGGGTQWQRLETSDNRALAMTISLDASGLPKTGRVADTKDRTLADFKYALAPRAEAFPDTTFDFAAVGENQIVEDAVLKSADEYTAEDASSRFNKGVALWRHTEDLPAAIALWEKLPAEATAPQLAIYEAALASRDSPRAQKALGNLSRLLGANSLEVLRRRANLAIQQRNWAEAQNALESALRAQNQNTELKILMADVLRAQSGYSRARVLLLEVLQSEAAPSFAKAEAAALLAQTSVGQSEDVLKALPDGENASRWTRLARAGVLALHNKDYAAIEKDWMENGDVGALTFLATLRERNGEDEQAIALWQKIAARAPSPDDREARLHLIALYARRGEVTPSLQQYRELINATPDLKTQREWQEALIAAWRKALRQEQLRVAIQGRATSTNASEDDARLWLTFQENFGTPNNVNEAIENGLARFERSAWWRARQAEHLLGQANATMETAPRDRLQREALSAAESAVALDEAQPYYAAVRAMILTQRATPITGITETGRLDPLRKPAFEALSTLLEKWPNDPDIQLAVATQRLALENNNEHDATIGLLQAALRGGAVDEEDRHFISFSGRQVLAAALREGRQNEEAAHQYEILFRASRTWSEQLGVALNRVRILMHRKNWKTLAQTLIELAREPWPFDDSQQLMQPLVNVVMQKNDTASGVLTALQTARDPYARYLAALMAVNDARMTKAILAHPQAPLDAERNADAAQKLLAASLQELEPVAEGEDRVLASRAAALLGEQALGRGDAATGEKWLARAIALEPRDANLRAALVTSRLAQKKITEALQARDEMLRALPHTPENLRRIAIVSDKIAGEGDEETTARLAAMAMNAAQVAGDVSSGDWQRAALIAARTGLFADKTAEGTAIYNGLASEQWSATDRAVALIDWEETLRGMNRADQAALIAQRLEELNLTPQQRNTAENAWESLK